ncbi:DNA alkylation repair protein [Burkholderia anthina]|uniref:DNA alkylation repair protein n=1 Tax=Burkholderia anthina TaxID=179879 RepID=UPI001FC8C90A|nr:DNA alkylation repair protein [Burkholderia anthina]
MSDLVPERKTALNSGMAATTNLTECLAIDQAALAKAVLPSMGLDVALESVLAAQEKVSSKGISHQMAAIGLAIGNAVLNMPVRKAAVAQDGLRHHISDTVRSWAAFAVTRADADLGLCTRLDAVRPYAADTHFGVREWAWIAVRPYVSADVQGAISILLAWTASSDPYVRRFASESIRPRGVWCEHITLLKTHPEIAERLLEALKADDARYVQDSVANWLNDASKTSPEWVSELCERWGREGVPATDRIVGRALRTLRKKGRVVSDVEPKR